MYAISNVVQEKLVKHNDREEYLGMMGTFGATFGVAQLLIMETHAFNGVTWSMEVVGFVVGFVLCLNLMYSRASLFLKHCDAALLNLSLLTSDVYAVIFSYFCYGYLVSWLYFLSFGLACLGLGIYSTAQSPTSPSSSASAGALSKDGASTPDKEDNDDIRSRATFQATYLSVPPADHSY